MNRQIICKECEKKIPAYILKELQDEETLEMIEHIKACPSCKDELTIQSMVSVGLNNLDEIININVDMEMDKRKKEVLRRMYSLDLKERIYLGALFAGVSTLFMAVLLIIL